MKKLLFLLSFGAISSLFAQTTIKKIAFGSCGHQDKPQPILTTVDSLYKPDIFIYLGDNIYGDSHSMAALRKKYAALAAKTEFQKLRKNRKIIATWDDHDYGKNDAGAEYAQKKQSKKVFLKFWEEPENSPRWKHEGIYTSYQFQTAGKKNIQIIVLDNRTFRSKLLKANPNDKRDKNDYTVNNDYHASMLGSQQWKWLEGELLKPADVRIICTSTQFCVEYNGYEAWANFPLEQAKMIDLIEKTQANGVMFISGDVHYAELNVAKPENMYPLYDVTSSGITETWDHVEPSVYREGQAFQPNNFGGIEFIEGEKGALKIRLSVFDVKGVAKIQKEVLISEQQLPKKL